MSKLTGLFPMSVKPRRNGVYQMTTMWHTIVYAQWCDKQWHTTDNTPKGAAASTDRSEDCYDGFVAGWRGLAKAPK